MKTGMKVCAALFACAFSATAFCAAVIEEKAPGNAFKGPDGKYRKALVVMWDGARGDVVCKPEIAPNLNKLARAGASSFTAFTGGFPNDPVTRTPSISAPGFMNTFSGVFSNKHKITGNGPQKTNWSEYPSFFKRLKDASSGNAYIEGFFGWKPMWERFVALEDGVQYDKVMAGEAIDVEEAATIINQLATNKKLDFLFIETAEPDGAGHASGFSAENPNYVKEIQKLDASLQQLVDTIKKRDSFAQENWLILVSTDHGGTGREHDRNTPSDCNVFVVAVSPEIKAGTTIADPVSHIDIYPTLMKHFGIEVKPEWKLEGKAVY